MTRILFIVQIIAAWTYVIFQTKQIFSGNTQGLNLTLWLMFIMYLVFSLNLAIASYRQRPTINRRNTVSIFIQFVFIFVWLFAIGVTSIKWTNGDTIIISIVSILCSITIYKYRGYRDHIARGLLAMWCKGITQLWTAYTIWDAQSSIGLPVMAMVASHVLSMPRFITVCLSGRKDGWDRPTRGLFIGESANVVTWAIVTIIWFWMR